MCLAVQASLEVRFYRSIVCSKVEVARQSIASERRRRGGLAVDRPARTSRALQSFYRTQNSLGSLLSLLPTYYYSCTQLCSTKLRRLHTLLRRLAHSTFWIARTCFCSDSICVLPFSFTLDLFALATPRYNTTRSTLGTTKDSGEFQHDNPNSVLLLFELQSSPAPFVRPSQLTLLFRPTRPARSLLHRIRIASRSVVARDVL